MDDEITGEGSGRGIEVDRDFAGSAWARYRGEHYKESWFSFEKPLASETRDRHGQSTLWTNTSYRVCISNKSFA